MKDNIKLRKQTKLAEEAITSNRSLISSLSTVSSKAIPICNS